MSRIIASIASNDKLKESLPMVMVLLIGAAISWLSVFNDFTISILVIVACIAVIAIAGTISNPLYAVFFILVLDVFFAYIPRAVPAFKEFPIGTIIDGICLLGLISVIINYTYKKQFNLNFFTNPIGYFLLISLFYVLLQVINPNADSFAGWLNMGFRPQMMTIAYFALLYYALSSYKNIKYFTVFWISIACFTGLYGMSQEYLGLLPWDEKFYLTPGVFDLHWTFGKIRIFSVYDNATTFGMFMTMGFIVCIVMLIGPYKIEKKIIIALAAIIMLLGAYYSGTRTAYLMITLGLAFVFLMNFDDLRIFLVSITAFVFLIGLLNAPIYGSANFNRFRSAFFPDKDASMQVREDNRAAIQRYIYEHPFGGGIATTGMLGEDYNPRHQLAGFPPDSLFLKMALERGWFGLVLILSFYFTIMLTGVNGFFKAKNPKVKNIYLAYLGAIFPTSIAGLTQEIEQKPMFIIIFGAIVIFLNLVKYESEIEKSQNTTKAT
ncbi:MAG: O-antigen ligase family protein [Cyclobacteriaceae bacterium]|nr:O-antigen ligase family protein [Cyclobacteriaceae bacterium]